MADILPRIIQGGMGVAVSNWRLANVVRKFVTVPDASRGAFAERSVSVP